MEMMHGKEEARSAKKRKIQRFQSSPEEIDGQDFAGMLPDDCISHIFSFLTAPRDRCSCAAVCRRWLILQALLAAASAGDTAAAPPRRFDCREASDARLAAMAVGSTFSGSPSEIHVQAFSLFSSSLMAFSDLGLSFVSLSCTKLKSLSLWNCCYVSDRGLTSIARLCPQLQKLDISNVPKLTSSGLIAIAKACRKLSQLRVENCPLVGDRALESFAKYSAELKLMAIGNCPLVGSSGSLSFPSSLSKLALTRVPLTDQALVDLSQTLVDLHSLELVKCHEVTSEGLMEGLKNWSLSLRALSLVKCNGVGGALRGGGDGFLGLSHFLQSVTIKGCPRVCDEFLYSLGKKMVKARSLSLVDLAEITDSGFVLLMAAMRRRDGLRSVDLSGCKRITDWSVAAAVAAAGGKLRRLRLDGCDGVTDGSLRLIGHFCDRLVELHVAWCGGIGDGGVAELLGGADAAPPRKDWRLRVLSLEGCGKITDESLRRLEEMAFERGLTGLNLKYCGGISAAAVAAVRRALWWCDLIS